MKSIVIFASGSGSNAENIIATLSPQSLQVTRIYCNNPNAGIIARAERLNVPVCLIPKSEWSEAGDFEWQQQLRQDAPDLIVLAGFLWKIPPFLIEEFPDKIINLHPALLPKFGGKGMYGQRVHEAVLDQNELNTGISIHYVNAQYDEGALIFQAQIPVAPSQNAEDLAKRIHELEHTHFPNVLLELLYP
jgi:phosphoribosylglycinamide formyltransferase-1